MGRCPRPIRAHVDATAHALAQRLTVRRPPDVKTVEALQRLYVDLLREYLLEQRLDEAVQVLHLLDVTPEMTEIPLHELFMALLCLAGALPRDKVRRFGRIWVRFGLGRGVGWVRGVGWGVRWSGAGGGVGQG